MRSLGVAPLALTAFLLPSVAAEAAPRKPLSGFSQVAPNLWVPYDLPAFAVQGHGNSARFLLRAGLEVPRVAFESFVLDDLGLSGTSTTVKLPRPMFSTNVEFVFGGGGGPAQGLERGTFLWTRGKKGIDPATGVYRQTTTYWSPAEALNEQLSSLPRTDRLRVYAWCDSFATQGLHAPTQLRLRLLSAWEHPYYPPGAMLEAPGFSGVTLRPDQVGALVFRGQMELPVHGARQIAQMLGPGRYVDAPFNNRVTRLLSDRYFHALNTSVRLRRAWNLGHARIPYTPSLVGLLLGIDFALHMGEAGAGPAAVGFAAGIGTGHMVATLSRGAVDAILRRGFVGTAAVLSRSLPVVGWAVLAADSLLLIDNWLAGGEPVTWGDVWDYYTGKLDVVAAGPPAAADQVAYYD